MIDSIHIRLANFNDAIDRAAFLNLLDHYSRDPFGGGQPLDAEIAKRLPDSWSAHAGAFTLLAWNNTEPLGLANCLTSFSTFRAAPRINIHDLVVHASARGMGLGKRLIHAVANEAQRRQACQVTLEVRADNETARRLYQNCGFKGIEHPVDQQTHFFGVLQL
jgi:ribosomal protein S18 acetylase RimI-like enzyme